MLKSVSPSDLSTLELLKAHKELHHIAGDRPSLTRVAHEQALCKQLTQRGFHPRYVDALAKSAGTTPAAGTPPMTLDEATAYATGPVGLHPQAVTLGKSLSDPHHLYIGIASPALRTIADSILKAVQREMPPGVQLVLDEQAQGDDFIQAQALYALQLVPATSRKSIITTVKAYRDSFRASAASASRVFKADADPTIPLRIFKQGPGEYEQVVTGAVLVPDEPDGSRTDESEADIYDAQEIQKGMYWFMENAKMAFSYFHVDHGGRLLDPGDVVLLENWQARMDYIEGVQPVSQGTWMQTDRINHPQLWDDILTGKINSFSLGLNCMAAFEEAV